jgi:hypothetical protein
MTEHRDRVNPIKHTHRQNAMSHAKLKQHMVEEHGWSDEMIRKRGDRDNGAYLAGAHDSEHRTAHLDPRGWWRRRSR